VEGKELRDLPEEELRRVARENFEALQRRQSAAVDTALALTAQLYMGELDRRQNEATSSRDLELAKRSHTMEVWVIILIGIEILLAGGSFAYGIHEGNKQLEVLKQLNVSTAATANNSETQANRLKTLADEQAQSLDSLQKMNDQLQTSLQTTIKMEVAMQKQLRILQDEQARRLAEQAKKPKLEVFVGQSPLVSIVPNLPLVPTEFTISKAVWDISLRNSGSAPATRGLLRIIAFDKDVTLDCSFPHQQIHEGKPNESQHAMLVPFEVLRPNGNILMSVIANYPAGQPQFVLLFNVDADEIPVATPLGVITVTPPKR
jgi:hypothetical protein